MAARLSHILSLKVYNGRITQIEKIRIKAYLPGLVNIQKAIENGD